MKGTEFETVGNNQDISAKVSHEVTGHGDPLFHSVLEHDIPRMNPLHAEFKGHGDPLLGAFIDEWHVVAADNQNEAGSELRHEMKRHGDPLLMETIPNETNTSGTKV